MILVSALLASACATVTRGSSEDVQFISNPPGATMKTSLGQSCITPCSIKIGRRDTFTATFTLGEHTRQVFVDTKVAQDAATAVGIGNAVAGGIVGVGVDVATGAGLDHVPNPVRVQFDDVEVKGPPAAPDTDGVVTQQPVVLN